MTMSEVFIDSMITYAGSFVIGLVIGIAIYELNHKKKWQTGGTGHDEISKAYSQTLQDRPIPMEHEHDD